MDPVLVHITGTDVPPPVQYRERYSTETRTIVITAAEPVQKLVDQDYNRTEFWIQPLDFDATICHSKAQAQAAGNVPAATQSFPDGGYIPKTNPQLSGPFKGHDDMWIVSGGNASPYPNRVTVIITRCTREPIP
jgi:hypothetical protein